MPHELRFWAVSENDRLQEVIHDKLDLENRLEAWIVQDISTLANDLLLIGRQTLTDFGGYLDLLCMDSEGNLALVELKRDRTPRDITAQVLDYASWVETLSRDRIIQIADAYLGENGPLLKAFAKKFATELPETLNQKQRMIVVASRIDASTERIIRYLSDSFGVDINAATFTYFRERETGKEFLGRSFLIDPDEVDYKSKTQSTSKQSRYLSFEELEGIAKENGVDPIYKQLVQGLKDLFAARPDRTKNGVRFAADLEGTRRVVLSLVVTESSSTEGLKYIVYWPRFLRYFGLDEAAALAILPNSREPYAYYKGAPPDFTGYTGFFRSEKEAASFIQGLRERSQ